MADWTSRTVVTTVKEYSLSSPTNWTQVRQVLHMIDQELPEGRRYDDTVTVKAFDNEILFTYTVKNESG
jgi:hypothetical protein